MNRTILLSMALLFVVAVHASAWNVSGNLSLNITNSTGSLSYPGGNYTFNATNDTLFGLYFQTLFNLSFDLPNATNLSMNLSRGETRNFSGVYDNLSLTCSNDPVFNETFNISREIRRGQTLEETVGSCNLRLSCAGTCSDNQSYEVSQQISMTKVGNQLTVTSGNNTKTFNTDIQNSSDTITFTYYCPNTIEEVVQADNETQLRVAYDFCQAEFPLLNQWLNTTLNKCSDNWDAYRDFVKAHNEQVIGQSQELANALSRVSSLETELELKNNRIGELQTEVLAERDRTDGRDVMLAIMSFIIIGCITIIFIMRNSGEEVGQ
jgi:hypothetical protein